MNMDSDSRFIGKLEGQVQALEDKLETLGSDVYKQLAGLRSDAKRIETKADSISSKLDQNIDWRIIGGFLAVLAIVSGAIGSTIIAAFAR